MNCVKYDIVLSAVFPMNYPENAGVFQLRLGCKSYLLLCYGTKAICISVHVIRI
jgi:hypothetical protein